MKRPLGHQLDDMNELTICGGQRELARGRRDHRRYIDVQGKGFSCRDWGLLLQLANRDPVVSSERSFDKTLDKSEQQGAPFVLATFYGLIRY